MTSGESPLAHAYHVWSTSVNAMVNYEHFYSIGRNSEQERKQQRN